jgi:hypothetical protein
MAQSAWQFDTIQVRAQCAREFHAENRLLCCIARRAIPCSRGTDGDQNGPQAQRLTSVVVRTMLMI